MKKTTFRTWALIWGLGLAGQLCWNIENQWFNTFIYENIAPNPAIISWMVAISSIMTTFSTFFFGTLSDRIGSRKPFISIGYILWGVFTIIFGLTMYVPRSVSGGIMLVATIVVISDAVMSFFGSMGNDCGFSAWTTDILTDENRGKIGATIAVQPVLGTIIGTLVGGIIVENLGYMIFFLVMGIFVILFGIIALLFVRDGEDVKPYKDGTFFHQFMVSFKFKEFWKRKELVFVNLIVMIFFIGFNVYFNHIGNLLIYNQDYGFSEGDYGLILGVCLLVAALFTIPSIKIIEKNKSPMLLVISFILNIVGLLILFFFGKYNDNQNLLSAANIPLFIGVIMVGIGYMVTLQTTTIWAKKLYPENSRGQFEGIRILFFVMIPMILGSIISGVIIKAYGNTFTKEYSTGLITGQTPTELLFVIAAVITIFAFIPLYFAAKYHNSRIKELASQNQ